MFKSFCFILVLAVLYVECYPSGKDTCNDNIKVEQQCEDRGKEEQSCKQEEKCEVEKKTQVEKKEVCQEENKNVREESKQHKGGCQGGQVVEVIGKGRGKGHEHHKKGCVEECKGQQKQVVKKTEKKEECKESEKGGKKEIRKH